MRFVKSYAKLLNVDIEDELDIIEQDVNTIDHKNDSKKSRIKGITQAYFFYIILCFVLLILVIYFLNSNDKNSIDNFYGLKNKHHFTDNKKYSSWKKNLWKPVNMLYLGKILKKKEKEHNLNNIYR